MNTRPPRDPTAFGLRLQRAIQQRYGTRGQGTFARALGVPRSMVTAWIYDRLPDTPHLIAMARRLGVSVDALLFGVEGGPARSEPHRRCHLLIDQCSEEVVRGLVTVLEDLVRSASRS